jgi:hypothetical protein
MSKSPAKTKSTKEDLQQKILTQKKFKTVIEEDKDSKNDTAFKRIINLYLQNLTKFTDNIVPELEIRFGTKKIKNITKIDFYNVIKSIISNNFKLNNENYYLKIIQDSEHHDIRTVLSGLVNIQNYCKFNNITSIEDDSCLSFIEKKYFKIPGTEDILYPLDFDDYNFRISFQTEKIHKKNESNIQELLSKWSSTKKIFRYIKRFEYKHPELPFLIHCSIVKTSKTNYGKMVTQFNIEDSQVFDSLEHYEIEIELNNDIIGIGTSYDTGINIYKSLKKVIKHILTGLQQTNYPVSFNEQMAIINNYLKITKGQEYKSKTELSENNPRDFVGPSSNTLQMINLQHIGKLDSSIPNIRKNYTVTDKADGMRKLLFISNTGKIYLISTLMNIEFTGTFTENKDLFNTIIDGEHITHNKDSNYINLFAAFDIYYIKLKNVTSFPFTKITDFEELKKLETEKKLSHKKSKFEEPSTEEDLSELLKEDETSKKDKQAKEILYRLNILNSAIKKLNLKSVISSKKPSIKITLKKFYDNVFNGSNTILTNLEKGLYEYNTDGLIFTPANVGVTNTPYGKNAPNYKTTWVESFKWKPAEFNTIDFLIKIKKNEFGKNIIGNLFDKGTNTVSSEIKKQYYTLILHVGFDEKKHGYINPFNDLINNNIDFGKNKQYSRNDYKPARFYPTNPSDINAGICNIMGISDESNNLKIYTEEGEEIEDNTIIEFKYVHTNHEFWKWVPLRVRNDKTAELRSGIKNFGNAYHVANSNWQSIHNPITQKIISSGENIPELLGDDDVYYNKVSGKTETRSLRDFHNLYVKSLLISKTSNSGNSLIDFACGKGGDLPKWINSNFGFVFGIDLSKDNIENRLDGACARYLNYASKFQKLPSALFINGNSSVNIRSGDAFYNEKNKMIAKAIFGEGTKNEISLGRGVYKNYGIAKNGFNISSIQFALHYMFEDLSTLNSFLKNVSQNTALEGYFIGCCYDGKKIFNMLDTKSEGEKISLFKNSKKIWEITKKYQHKEYIEDETCMGYAIDVYQESINKTFREYLVNFEYLIRIMENYGFVQLTLDEVKQLDLPGSIGNFKELYNFMEYEVKRDKKFENKIGNSLNMSDEEKTISFLNNYFIFKKVRNVEDLDSEFKTMEKEKEIPKVEKEFEEIDSSVKKLEKDSIQEKSKELAQKYLDSTLKKELENPTDAPIPLKTKSKTQKPMDKITLTIDEKIALAEKKKKEKEEEKQRLKEEKLKEKQRLKEEKEKLKIQSKLEKTKKK